MNNRAMTTNEYKALSKSQQSMPEVIESLSYEDLISLLIDDGIEIDVKNIIQTYILKVKNSLSAEDISSAVNICKSDRSACNSKIDKVPFYKQTTFWIGLYGLYATAFETIVTLDSGNFSELGMPILLPIILMIIMQVFRKRNVIEFVYTLLISILVVLTLQSLA